MVPALLALDPKAAMLFKKALAENASGNYSAALKLFFDAHREDPEVLAKDDEGLLKNAEFWLADQLDVNDSDVHTQFQMAELVYLQGNPQRALRHYKKVVEIDPNSALARLSGPLIQDIESRQGQVVTLNLPAASSNANQLSEATDEIQTLKDQIQSKDQEIERLKAQLETAKNKSQGGGEELQKLKKEFADYKKEAERWKIGWRIWLSNQN